MDKSAIKSFAIEARKILMKSAITQAGFYGVSKDGCAQPTQKGAGFEVYRTIAGTDNRIFGDDIKRREKLVRAVEEKGFDQVIEETAYTWFNRLIAIRFMEVNGYLPTRTRVLSSETGSNTPDLMSQYLDVDLDMTMDELEKVQTCVRENRYDDAFALLFVKQCNALNEILPNLFEKTTDYMELLLKLSYTSDGVVRMLVDTIPESNFDIEQEGQIEIIGWMYQYYNTELKDDTFALLKKNVKITKERIPSATQLFTPDWIVRYMVENSLGRLWVEGHPDEDLKANWKYYLEEAEQEADVQAQLEGIRKEYRNLNPEDIKVIDPCMGSGHILVYCFDVLMQIYESRGYTQRDAARLILENNLYGLDTDKRATQLAYFAVMMKARQYDRRVFSRRIRPKVLAIEESNGINREQLKFFGQILNSDEKKVAIKQITELLNKLTDAREYGSIVKLENYDWDLLYRFTEDVNDEGQLSFDTIGIDRTKEHLNHIIKCGEVLTQKYQVVITNPPYMSSSGMNSKLQKYVRKYYADSKADMYAVFIEACQNMQVKNGFLSMITMQTWMFIGSYENLRRKLLKGSAITSLLQLGIKAFEEIGNDVVQTASFCTRKMNVTNYKGCYHQLTTHIRDDKIKQFFTREKQYFANQNNYSLVEGCPIAYWMPQSLAMIFANEKNIGQLAVAKIGIQTGNNELFVRFWTEVDINKVYYSNSKPSDFEKFKWFPYTKGGSFRKWYGNNELVINWLNRGKAIQDYNKFGSINDDFYYQKCITWGLVSSAGLNFRYVLDQSHVIGNGGPMAKANLGKEGLDYYILGLLNSCVTQYISDMLNPTINMSVGTVSSIPVLISEKKYELIVNLVKENITLCKADYDAHEMSLEYAKHPLLTGNANLEEAYSIWNAKCEERFEQLRKNEEYINQIFIEEYGLECELSNSVNEKYVSISKESAKDAIRSLISYAVGCMFGRYSIDKEGIAFAGGNWDVKRYVTFQPDRDNCIPITDEEYFEDDIVGVFCDWLQKAFGNEYYEENLEFVANALEIKGDTSKGIIRNYFLNEFFKDHCSEYSVFLAGRRPIYWLFDSGKQNGFKCLVYMHRYDKDTVGRVRSDYLRKSQEAIEAALKNAEYTIQNSTSAIDKATATKKRDKYIKQLTEIRTYFQALSHVALQRIDIDLDDGVKVNYEKFQNIEIVDENGKKQKINLLTKI